MPTRPHTRAVGYFALEVAYYIVDKFQKKCCFFGEIFKIYAKYRRISWTFLECQNFKTKFIVVFSLLHSREFLDNFVFYVWVNIRFL